MNDSRFPANYPQSLKLYSALMRATVPQQSPLTFTAQTGDFTFQASVQPNWAAVALWMEENPGTALLLAIGVGFGIGLGMASTHSSRQRSYPRRP